MKGIGFKNMKALKEEQWFDFRKITLLTGTNNSGKSSIINAMQMLQDNLDAKNIDELLKTKFTVKSKQDKHGSIASFVNNNNPDNPNDIIFYLAKANVRYAITLKITEGLETFCMVDKIVANCIKTGQKVFYVEVLDAPLKFTYKININYAYFIDRWNSKYEKTLKLREYIQELDKRAENVNQGKGDYKSFEAFARRVENEISVYISTTSPDVGGTALADNEQGFVETDGQCSYNIFYKHDSLVGKDYLDEIGVFTQIKTNNVLPKFKFEETILIDETELNSKYKSIYDLGVFDFTFIWHNLPVNETKFKDLLSSYYKTSYKKALRSFSDDLITVLSNIVWENLPYTGDEDPIFWSGNYIHHFLSSTMDFGLKAFLTKFMFDEIKLIFNSEKIEYEFDYLNFDESNTLKERGFFDDLLPELSNLIKESLIKINEDKVVDGRLKISDIQINALYQNYGIHTVLLKEIYEDITKSILNLDLRFNNSYVSSNRFSTKRTYSFNEQSDFTKYLKRIEHLSKEDRDKALGFVNKWIKDFDIADELLLKSDNETGTFKAYLRSGKSKNLLIDYGLGTNQLLPVIFALADIRRDNERELISKTVVIEEPEANLHPALQSKLADMFIDAKNSFFKQIIIETHSEYLIRKLQYNVAKSYLEPNDDEINLAAGDDNFEVGRKMRERRSRGYTTSNEIVIYYFNPDKNVNAKEPKVKKIEITELGTLTDTFGKGFFDEATQLQFDLMQLRKEQDN